MPRRIDVVLLEILEAIDGTLSTIEGKDLKRFESEWATKRAVERGLEIVSEAVRHLPQDLLDRHPEVPWREVKATGNRLRHEYHRIAAHIIWNIAVDELPPLRTAIAAMLEGLRR
jgi:uncharacterized protein with HEPN domain